MTTNALRSLIFMFFFGSFGFAIGSDTPSDETVDEVSTTGTAVIGDSEAGEARYAKTCINCHGAGGKGVASYPKVSGQEISYTTEKLETYRDGKKIGPNSSLMIMMAKPLTDEEIANLAAYLKDANN